VNATDDASQDPGERCRGMLLWDMARGLLLSQGSRGIRHVQHYSLPEYVYWSLRYMLAILLPEEWQGVV
jgi:hypothetical protein